MSPFALPPDYFAISGLDGQGTVYSFQMRILQQLHPVNNSDLSDYTRKLWLLP